MTTVTITVQPPDPPESYKSLVALLLLGVLMFALGVLSTKQ